MTSVALCALVSALATAPADSRIGLIDTDRALEVLPAQGDARAQLAAAGRALGDWTLDVAGVAVDGAALARLAATPEQEPLLRAAREQLGRPVDLEDFIYFLDDVLVAGAAGARGKPVVLTPDRARSFGIFLHPDDVFRNRPRRYGDPPGKMPVDPPPQPAVYQAPADGAPLGPAWTVRYASPDDEDALLVALKEARPNNDLDARVRALMGQLRAQGADVCLDATVRARARGYLMWGAYMLSRATSPAEVKARVRMLDRMNRRWRLHVPIRWRTAGGWTATRDAARMMAEAYNVVYASKNGARRSHHYGGFAVDLIAVNLPRRLTLEAPDGAKRTFDLSDPDESRDLSLSPQVFHWVERHFGLHKLKSDYPHWDDAR